MQLSEIIGKIKYKINMYTEYVKYVSVYSISGFFRNNPRYKNLWIISERGFDARDNAWHLFKYIRNEHPEINIRYIITDESKDAPKIKAIGDTIRFKSFDHYLSIALADMLISTHLCGYTTQDYVFCTLVDHQHLLKGRKIFLQHGIIKDDPRDAYSDVVNLDMFVTSIKPEYEYVREKTGFPDGVVKHLGLCRFDNLPLNNDGSRTPSRMILMMPTHRRYLSKLSLNDFTKTEFYRKWNELINSERLSSILKEHGYEAVFYPHVETQHFISCFKTSADNIRIGTKEEYDVQQLLIDTDLLITDYSSVYFDCAYMNKQSVYYQFDKAEYRKGQYKEGWFSYEEDGFGPVLDKASELIDYIEKMVADDCRPEEFYRHRIERVMGKLDHENCRRNFEAIMALQDATDVKA